MDTGYGLKTHLSLPLCHFVYHGWRRGDGSGVGEGASICCKRALNGFEIIFDRLFMYDAFAFRRFEVLTQL